MRPPQKSKRFRYNLASVLKVREIRETQEKEKFDEKQKELLEEKRKEAEIKAFQSKKYKELTEMLKPGAKNIDFYKVQMGKAHLEIVNEQVAEQVKKRQGAEEAVEKQRQELIKAIKNRKIMEKDRENKKKAWVDLMKKEDDKFMNEIASIAFVKKTRDN